MPRPGITKDDVARAMGELEAEGKSPTVRLVRAHLGTGSSTTILHHMAAVRTAATPRQPEPVAVPEILLEQLHALWQNSVDLASKENEAIRRAAHGAAYQLARSKEELGRVMERVMKHVDAQVESLHEIGDGKVLPLDSVSDESGQ